jgi:hypothetical protein
MQSSALRALFHLTSSKFSEHQLTLNQYIPVLNSINRRKAPEKALQRKAL